MDNRILITTNPLNHEGGVVNYYRIFFQKFKRDEFELIHHTFGSRMELFYSPWKKLVLYPFYYIIDFIRLFWRLNTDRQIRIVQVSPSLIPVPLVRDAFIVLGAKLLNRRVIVFFRGWKDHIVQQLKKRSLYRWMFCVVYRHTDLTLVLASRFKEDLIALGWDSSSVHITTTMYEEESILPPVVRSGKRPRFLFLGRISQLKGIDEFIQAAKILSEQCYDFECIMVGHGDREGVVEKYSRCVEEYSLCDCFRFMGRLTGREKFQAYAESDIFVFPSWTEGCPNSVLEALGAGLFVISTDVGALRDIIREDENGKIVRCKDPEHLAKLMGWVCENIELIRSRRGAIQEDARSRFEAEIIIKQLSNLYSGLIDG